MPLTRVPSCVPNPILQIRQDGTLRCANQAARDILGPYVETDSEFREQFLRTLQPAIEKEETVDGVQVDRRYFRVVPYRPSSTYGTLLFLHETTIRNRYLQIASLSEYVMDNTVEGVMVTDADGVIEQVNPAFTRITGFTPEEVVGETPSIMKSYHQDEEFYARMVEDLRSQGAWKGEIWNRKKDGEAIPLWESITRISGTEPEETRYVSLLHDLSDSSAGEEKTVHGHYQDLLTGLPNRQLFFDRLSQAIASARREEENIGVLLLDIDDFKKINDSLGHQYGDAYLRTIGARLSSVCREEDTIARLGGDEFGIINLRLEQQNHALEILERINSVLKQPITLDSHEIIPSASIGVTFYPEDGTDSDTLVKNADLAMYQAKRSERGRYALFNQELHNRAQQRINLETNLNRALEQGEFQLYYQPKVRASDGAVIGAEALVRWNHEGMVVSPAEFIPIAEEMGLIFPLGRKIISDACGDLLKFRRELGEEFSVAVNVSGKQFRDAALVSQLKTIFENTGIDPRGLSIEITENVAISDVDSTVHMMGELNELGVNLSIDDFGTGYSSLAYIKSFTAGELKIDRSFIRDLPGDCGDRAIVGAVISMAHELGMTVTAEGVEHEGQYNYLKSIHCDELQGYFFSPPVPFEALTALVRERRY
jgi:diguanylate cyclase (GGDEF)-like protein/PAS domain S-box-containing protein